jgi:hypothetical protein
MAGGLIRRNEKNPMPVVWTLPAADSTFSATQNVRKVQLVALRDKLRENAAHVLQPGETIQSVFCAQTTSQYFALISYWIILLSNAYRVVVVTDRRILVCSSGRLRMTPVNEVLRELPRSTRIGQPSGLWWRCESLGERLYINKRFHKDVNAADAVQAA